MSSLPAKKEEDQLKIKALECSQDFSLLSHGDFSRRSRAAYSAVHARIWSNFELVRDFIVVLVTCKNEEDPIKNEDARVFTTLYINFSDASADNARVGGGVWPKFEPIQAFMFILVICKNKDDSIKNERC